MLLVVVHALSDELEDEGFELVGGDGLFLVQSMRQQRHEDLWAPGRLDQSSGSFS